MKKLFSKKLWIVLTSVFAILMVGIMICSPIADYYSSQINSFFGCKTTDYEEDPFADLYDTQYYKPKFANADGTADKAKQLDYDKQVAREIDNEGSVLLWNNNDALPIAKSSKINLFGGRSVKYHYVTYGSGSCTHHEERTFYDAFTEQGYEVNSALWNFYSSKSSEGSTTAVNETKWSDITTNALSSIDGGVGIYVIGRKGAEGSDLSRTGSDGENGNLTALSQAEKDHLSNLVSLKQKGKLDKIVVLLNTVSMGVQFDVLSTYADKIDACMWIGLGGVSGPDSVVDLLSGKAVPSGRLSDTYLYDNLSAPATVNFGDYDYSGMSAFSSDSVYKKLSKAQSSGDSTEKNLKYIVYQEGIYVGYRYYETRYEDTVLNQGQASSAVGVKAGASEWRYSDYVAYPFGYGTSYTTFTQKVEKWMETDDSYVVSVKVTNTGSKYSGKEVVQVYLQKPYTDYDKENGIEQSSVILAGFAKTSLLAPGKSEVVEVKVDKNEFLTYDANKAKTYITEGGDFYLAVGNNAHDALNNILAKKGKTIANGMDYNGDAEKVHKIGKKADYKTAVSRYTGNEITNRFEEADLNKNGYGTSVTYLSRSNWKSTYPTSAVSVKLTANLLKQLDYGVVDWEEDPFDELPAYEQTNGLTLFTLWKDIDGNEIPFDSPLWDTLLDQMSYEEQTDIICNAWCSTQGAASIGLPATVDYDGPAGISYLPDPSKNYGLNMCYPSENLVASTFNVELAEKMGECLGEDNLACGVTFLYAPGNNVHRTAYGGRNGEYYSEDAVLAAYMCEAQVKGMQSNGAGAQIKHFALNDQETNRNGVAVWANEQSIRELYLKQYEYACAAGRGESLSVMSSFTRIGSKWSGAHYGLLTEVLRNEWGFKGFVQSDGNQYKLMSNYIDGIRAGNDIFMCGGGKTALKDYKNSTTIANAMRLCVKHVLYSVVRTNAMNGITASTRIVTITPWWKYAIIGLKIGFIVLTAASAVMLALSVWFDVKNKKTAKAE